jgi:hypothetical protein
VLPLPAPLNVASSLVVGGEPPLQLPVVAHDVFVVPRQEPVAARAEEEPPMATAATIAPAKSVCQVDFRLDFRNVAFDTAPSFLLANRECGVSTLPSGISQT